MALFLISKMVLRFKPLIVCEYDEKRDHTVSCTYLIIINVNTTY